jgi:hypothetical protein
VIAIRAVARANMHSALTRVNNKGCERVATDRLESFGAGFVQGP